SVTAGRRQEERSARRPGCRHRPGATPVGRRVHRPPTIPETVTRSLCRHLPCGIKRSVGSPPDSHHGHVPRNHFADYSTGADRAPIALEVLALIQNLFLHLLIDMRVRTEAGPALSCGHTARAVTQRKSALAERKAEEP